MSPLPALKNNIKNIGLNKLLLSLLFILAIGLNLSHSLDTSSKQYIDKAFNRALVSFAIAKSLNGVISVAQGTEIAFQPAGIGINIMPGQILDPVNDLVERFSWVMLASTISLGIQKIFLTMSIWPTFSHVLVLILILGIVSLFIKTRKFSYTRTVILRTALILIVLRFAVPIAGLGNEMVYQIFLENEYISSTKLLTATTEKLGQLNNNIKFEQPDFKKKSVWESAKAFYNSTSEMLNISKKIGKYKKVVKDSTRHIINIIVVFMFQTIIIPLIFILIIYKSLKVILNINFIRI